MKRAARAPTRLDEARAVALFQRQFGGSKRRGVELGIGDDAAVLAAPRGRLVVTVDASVEGTHFRRALLPLEDIGFRAFQAAASDLAAMGARPLAAVSALTLPRDFSTRELERLTAGQALAARDCSCPIVGGNVARSTRLTLTTTLFGSVSAPLTRSGARAGDECWLVGEVGLAAAGFQLLAQKKPRSGRAAARCVEAWRRPRALIRQGLALARLAHAVVDVSDGLGGDATRLADASACRLLLEESALRGVLSPALVAVAAVLRRDPLGLALSGGEDYALVVAAKPGAPRPRWARRIGRFEAGRGGYLELSDGRRASLGAGFDHFAR